jgi:hypothetical protein
MMASRISRTQTKLVWREINLTTSHEDVDMFSHLIKLTLARRETFLYKQSGVVTNCKSEMFYWNFTAPYKQLDVKRTRVTRKTTKNRTEPIEEPKDGTNLTRTFDSVSPTTTLYDIIAASVEKKINVSIELLIEMMSSLPTQKRIQELEEGE